MRHSILIYILSPVLICLCPLQFLHPPPLAPSSLPPPPVSAGPLVITSTLALCADQIDRPPPAVLPTTWYVGETLCIDQNIVGLPVGAALVSHKVFVNGTLTTHDGPFPPSQCSFEQSSIARALTRAPVGGQRDAREPPRWGHCFAECRPLLLHASHSAASRLGKPECLLPEK